MIVIPFDILNNYFALEIDSIVEIIPLVNIDTVVDSNPKLRGLINYRGNLIPIIDLKNFFYKENSINLLSTRIVIYSFNNNIIGVIVENLTDTIEIDKNNLINESQKLSGSNFIKSYFIEDEKTIKIIDVQKIYESVYS